MLHIKRPIYKVMLHHVKWVYPEEACGLLAGYDGTIDTLYAVENQLHSPTAYEMAPKQQLEAMLAIENAQQDTMVIYHSHPHGPAEPSPTDIQRVTFPDAYYVIVSLGQLVPQVRAFSFQTGDFHDISWQLV